MHSPDVQNLSTKNEMQETLTLVHSIWPALVPDTARNNEHEVNFFKRINTAFQIQNIITNTVFLPYDYQSKCIAYGNVK